MTNPSQEDSRDSVAPDSAFPALTQRAWLTWKRATVFVALLLLDLAFVAVHWALRNDRIAAFDLEQPASVPAILQWLQLAAATGLFLFAYARLRRPVYAAGAAILGVVVADDTLELHERFGAWSENTHVLPSLGGLEPHDLGEFALGALLGLTILALAVWAWVRSVRSERTLLAMLFGLVALLGFFGFLVDAFHSSLPEQSLREVFVGTVEDGGEMVVSTLVLALVWWHVDARMRANHTASQERPRSHQGT